LTGKLAFLNSIIFAIGMIVAFVPKGLLPTLSLSLALAGQRMAGKNALVKKLSGVETLGAATVICTDKTGTLTTSKIMVVSIYLGGNLLKVTGSGSDLQGRLELAGAPLPPDKLQSPLLNLTTTCAILCNNASLVPGGEAVTGDPTEAALLVLAAKAGCDLAEIHRTQPRLQVFSFESVRKRMSTVNGAPRGGRRSWVKGAPESLIPLCSTITDWNGDRRPFTPGEQTKVLQTLNEFAQGGLRVLALAWKEGGLPEATQSQVEGDLSFLAIIGMMAPPGRKCRQPLKNVSTRASASSWSPEISALPPGPWLRRSAWGWTSAFPSFPGRQSPTCPRKN
jgi:magnesium-transporting ATPase (P-type)